MTTTVEAIGVRPPLTTSIQASRKPLTDNEIRNKAREILDKAGLENVKFNLNVGGPRKKLVIETVLRRACPRVSQVIDELIFTLGITVTYGSDRGT